MRISDWSSDVCSSDLAQFGIALAIGRQSRREPFGGEIARSGDCQRFRRLALLHRPHRFLELEKARPRRQIGRASCRERVCQHVEYSVVAVSLKKNKKTR